jgi:hypothetical protein
MTEWIERIVLIHFFAGDVGFDLDLVSVQVRRQKTPSEPTAKPLPTKRTS